MQILLFVTFLCTGAMAQNPVPEPQTPASLLQYPEIGRLEKSSYCNPYFGFRLALPTEFKPERMYLPVQPHGKHMLYAMHMQRLDRSADLLISAFEDSSDDPARIAAKARVLQARHGGLEASGPQVLSVHEHELHRLHITSDPEGPGDESSFFFALRGFVVHVAIFAHEKDLAAPLESAIEHIEFVEPGESACATAPPSHDAAPVPASVAMSTDPISSRIYYGPALPTDLVDATVRSAPGASIPGGQFAHRIFADPALGVRVELPQGWQPMPTDEAYRVTELMRDPTSDPGSTDRRRALFRACTSVIFAADNPNVELISQVHPALAIAALRRGCVPDMVPPETMDDKSGAAEFATVVARSLGTFSLERGSIHQAGDGRLEFHLDGALPYKVPGEMLARRLSLRITATASGPWLILAYSVMPTHGAQRELESHISIGNLATDSISKGSAANGSAGTRIGH